MIEVYERSAKDGYTAQDLVKNDGNWTGILLAYGLAQPRKGTTGGCDVEQIEPPTDDKDVQEEAVEEDSGQYDLEDDASSDDPEEGTVAGNPDASHEETTEEVPPVTDDQIGAAETFVSAVGGLEHAARTLLASSVRSGDRAAVKSTVTEVVRAARAILTPSEIGEIVIVGNAEAKGITVVSI
jgi:hypothetical protein